MTTGGTPPGDGSYNPYGVGSGQPGWSQEPYPGQGYGQEPYPGQGNDQSGYGQQYGAGYPQPGSPGGAVATGKIAATDAISAAWQLFKSNPLPWVLITLVMGISSFIASLISGSDSAGISFLGTLLTFAVSVLFSAFMIRGALLEVDGFKPEFGDFFKLHNFGWFVLATILVGIATGIPTGISSGIIIGIFAGLPVFSVLFAILFLILGVLITFFLYWTSSFVIDRNMTALDGIKSSVNAIKSDGGNLFLLAILNVLIIVVGTFALIVGLLVAIPIAMLASMVAYRAITGASDFSRTAASAV